ncbi:uncharacterized protein TNCT_604861 [Trichonephila clavata]|uniref:Protein preY, mitochondrial n=1 Tax=Trichonephila clavata TaxID=2740835 RepID=A0A8X6F967_TRICU|nr:uncharacterized protein TNCT_604861 [Trichonephila clavata]
MFRLCLFHRSRFLITNLVCRLSLFPFSTEATASDSSNDSQVKKLDDHLLSLIVCPITKKKLRYDTKRQLLINDELGIGFKIINDIPNLVPTDAIKI